ncbi:uncharacterized protein LOC133845451 [Drosophila sulfurigaster albostrigata]|uniref:uncharacterized protein LOC133845451 n=1 Tax=Drosophila sulfurigaster albostrigata TaxID=89887 RepID=UPI002D21BD5B|nr:uncharacterized protein LOC133845451 [Drosophila sulfurigaster albostrigata]XP_062135897.1 uncharacterized protein LOC133845451 [Drosophila sulfurigaster albostrigata]
MAQILGLQILCVGFLLLTGAGRGCEGATATASASASASSSSAALLSDSESYHDKCADFKCPELPECPDDSEASDFYVLTDFQFSHDRERAKRDLQTDLQAECCYQPQCRCNKCPEQPQCENEEVLIELSAASGQPGNCCPQFECGKEPQCEAGNKNLTYWLNRCTKCNSCQVPPCQDVCYQADLPHNCMSHDKQLMYNGDTWLEGCIECKCIDGDKQCIAPKDCQLYDSDVQLVEKSTSTSKTPMTSTPSTTISLTTEAGVVKETSSSVEMSLEEIELKTSSEHPIVQPELKSGAEESIDMPEIVETESELKQPTVETELKSSVETAPKSETVGTQLNTDIVKLELLAGSTITSNSSTNDDLDETTTPAMESENTDELPLDNTETPLSEEKDTDAKDLNIASTADFSSSTSSTLQQEIETEDSIEESTETALDNLELDSTLSTTESTFASAASSSAPDSTTNASSSAASSALPDSTTKTSSTAASSASPDSTTNSSSSAASSASPDSTTNSSSSVASSASLESNTSTASSPSTLTTESPAALATSSPAPLTPESTSFHRDADILDADYRLASASPNDAGKHPTNLHNLLKFILFIFVVLIACIVLMAFIYIYLRRRKSMYSKVVQSDSNLSENTHTSDLVLDIDTDDTDLPQKQQLKEFVE